MTICKPSQQKLCGKEECQICLKRSFASYDGETEKGTRKVELWDEEKNKCKPYQVSIGTDKKYWFNCDSCPHSFESSLCNVTGLNRWCPYCSNNKLCKDINCKICLEKSFASYDGKTEKGYRKVDLWDEEKNKCKPYQVFKSTGKKYWFNCDSCPHSFESQPNSIIKGSWCRYCGNQDLCNDVNCKFCLENSFASYDGKTVKGTKKIDLWDEKNKCKPNKVFKNSHKKYSFNCDSCPHSFESTISNITRIESWCPYCSNPPQKLCKDENCEFCFENSFASYDGKTVKGTRKVDLWDEEKNKCKPYQIFKSSGTKYWFNCDSCPHSFESILGNITRMESWCPYCAVPTQKLCKDEHCKFCFENSFASYDGKTVKGTRKVDLWDEEKNKCKPYEVSKCSPKKYSFNCDSCQLPFPKNLSNLVKGSWCPNCKNKTELKFLKWLKDNFNYKIKKQPRYDWCRKESTNRQLPFDFAIEELKLILEVDGAQHFIQVSNWDSPEDQHLNDKYKMTKANENGYSIIRILQEDIYSDKNNWADKTKRLIKRYPEPINLFVGNECYNQLRECKN